MIILINNNIKDAKLKIIYNMKVYRVRGIKMKMITKEWIRDYVKDNFKGLIKYIAI